MGMSKFIIEQYVIINGIMGYIDYIGNEVIILVNDNKVISIKIQDIKEVILIKNKKQSKKYTMEHKGNLYIEMNI